MQLNENITIQKGDCCELIKKLPDGSVDAIITDPPYLYLKNQKLDKPFDEETFFSEAKRVLKRRGFIVMFGRGMAFYRWNTRLADLGFSFKEEVIWNKRYISCPYAPLMRIHESISIFSKNNDAINKCYVPYVETKQYDIQSMQNDIKRLMTCFHNVENMQAVKKYLDTKQIEYSEQQKDGFYISIPQKNRKCSRAVSVIKAIHSGYVERSIIQTGRDHYTMQHPTQKPVRLMERLSALVTQEGDLVLDPFMGSGSTGIACINTGRRFIGYEIDDEYFGIAKGRLEEAKTEKSKELF